VRFLFLFLTRYAAVVNTTVADPDFLMTRKGTVYRLSRGKGLESDGRSPPGEGRPVRVDKDRVAQWYYRSDRLTNAALRTLRGLFEGIWLGVLSPEQIARIDEVYYHRATMYVTESYNRIGLWSWEQAAIDAHFGGVSQIIVTSAGGGREVAALAKAGYEVVGFEPHNDLVRFGNQLLAADGLTVEIGLTERDRWPTNAVDADGVIVGWGAYMLIAGRHHRVAFLQEAAKQLPAHAPLLLSFFPREGGEVRFRSVTLVANLLRRLLRRDAVAFGDALAPNLVHFFTRTEIAVEMAEAGFALVDFGIGTDGYGWAVGRCVAGRSIQRKERT
jgi:hypothetical protein